MCIFFTLPFVKINENPFLLINIIDGQFFIFGQPFYPQDFYILALTAVISVIFIMVFTVVFGRLFCGWICPQTIFMESVFRKIEYWIEGDSNKQLKWRKGEDRKASGKGDCIDCQQCIVVCPTGIDIRNGQQLECINCTACIDACDEVMEKVGLPKGLIRYATEAEIEKQESFKFTARMKVSAFALLILLGFSGSLFQDRGSMEAKFLKSPGSSYISHSGQITNTFTYTFLNKSYKDQSVTIKVLEPPHALIFSPNGNILNVKGNKMLKGNINISFPEKEVKFYKQNINVGIFDKDRKLLDSYQTIFDGPYKIQL